MNPFVLEPSALLADWKKLRADLAHKPDHDQLEMVVKFWAQAPLMTIAYDPEALDTYPSAWEMMNYNDWCVNSVAVGMEFTLRLAGWSANRLRIHMMKDYDISDQRLVVEVDGKYLLNYDFQQVSEIPDTNFEVLAAWKHNGRKYQLLS
jgi:hypothetical protein